MLEKDLPRDVVHALIEKKYCVPDCVPDGFLECWLAAGAVCLALAWWWPSISELCRRRRSFPRRTALSSLGRIGALGPRVFRPAAVLRLAFERVTSAAFGLKAKYGRRLEGTSLSPFAGGAPARAGTDFTSDGSTVAITRPAFPAVERSYRLSFRLRAGALQDQGQEFGAAGDDRE